MRRLIVIEYVTVDGVVQAPGHDRKDPDGEFTPGGWSVPFLPDHGRYMREALNTMGAFLLGRRTYEIWAPYWPTVTDRDDEVARMLNAVPKYVASTTLASEGRERTTVIADVPAQVAELRGQGGKDIVVMGSSHLVQALGHHGLTASATCRFCGRG